MAASSDLKSCVADISSCPICFELFNNPKSLPCLHTFCLLCIERHYQDKPPGAEVSCPVCRKKFLIPSVGLASGLLHNFFIQSLVDARKAASDIAVEVPCEVCLEEADDNTGSVPDATMYCVDCKQKLCEQCSRPHRRMKGGAHKVIAIGEASDNHLTEACGQFCDKHSKEMVKLYCFYCKSNICLVCSAVEHDQHKRREIEKVAEEFGLQIDEDLLKITESIGNVQKKAECLGEKSSKFLATAEEIECAIRLKAEELKKMIDDHVSDLSKDLLGLKLKTCKEIESQKERIELALLSFESFKAYCTELKEKGHPCDITRTACDIRARAAELLHSDVMFNGSYSVPSIGFVPMSFQQLLTSGHQNIIGQVTFFAQVEGEQMFATESRPAEPACGKLEILTSSVPDPVCWISTSSEKNELHSSEKTTKLGSDLVANDERSRQRSHLQQKKCAGTGTLMEKLEKDKVLVSLNSLRKNNNELMAQMKTLSESEKTLRERLQQMTESESLLKEHLLSDSRIIRNLPLGKTVCGVALLDDLLYVLRRNTQAVEVYSTESYKLLHRLTLPGRLGVDLTSCGHFHCLYISDGEENCIHRIGSIVEGSFHASSWNVTDEPFSLSVTSKHNVLVCFKSITVIKEFTTYGVELLQVYIQGSYYPWHAVELTTGNIAVCYGADEDDNHGVIVIDYDGDILHSCSRKKGCASADQFDEPTYLAVDKDGYIYVSDHYNTRVVLLSPTLKYVRDVMSPSQFKRNPNAFCLDARKRYLYVIDDRRVTVVAL